MVKTIVFALFLFFSLGFKAFSLCDSVSSKEHMCPFQNYLPTQLFSGSKIDSIIYLQDHHVNMVAIC